MNDDVLKRKKNESVTDFQIRLFANHKSYHINSDDIADILNKELGQNYGESKYRKEYAQYLRWKDYLITKDLDKEIISKYEQIKVEAEKEKIRKQDQKREYKKLIRNQSRFEGLRDDIINAIQQASIKSPLLLSPSLPCFDDYDENRQGLALFSDWHFGADVHNSVNTYNKEEFNKRVKVLVEKIIKYGTQNHISTLNVAEIGDMVHGLIHVSARVQSNEDIIQQITYVSEILSDILYQLAHIFPHINAYFVNGNHSRPSGNKDDFGLNENFEYLLPWYIKARLQNVNNISLKSERDGYLVTNIFNNKVVFVHGQYDNPNNSVYNLSQMLGFLPDYIFSGHIHHNFEREFGKTRAIVNSSLIGPDDYSIAKRLTTRPSQKFLIFDKDEDLESTYEIYVA